jgi:hypothetical protein
MAISAARRRRLPKSSFGVPSKRKYPLDTKGRARNALARVSQHGTPAEKKMVRTKVKRKYPSIKVSGLKTAKPRRRKAR